MGNPSFPARPSSCSLKAALACRARENEINKILQNKGLPTFFTRMGINSGDALVGNIGFDKRMSYTAIGDSVNLASRLEGINKYYKTGILISEFTYESVKDSMLARFTDLVKVKGKAEGVRIYELLKELSNSTENEIAKVVRHNQAMELYLSRDWKSALEIFNELEDSDQDYSRQVIIERCRECITHPPGDDFVGVVALRNK